MDYKPVMTVAELSAFLDAEFPQINSGGRHYSVASISPGEAVLRLDPDQSHIRPGGTISGPTLFSLADLAAYAVILAHIGPVALAVTTNLNINFLRKPEVEPLVGKARLPHPLRCNRLSSKASTRKHPSIHNPRDEPHQCSAREKCRWTVATQ